jgi:hypothetical protein
VNQFVIEMRNAAKGMFALLIGRRNASSYFDLTLHGLAGSFIAFLLAAGASAYLPGFMGMASPDGIAAWQAFSIALPFYAVQMAFSALVLLQIKRLDGMMPYVVADNWAGFFITLVSIILVVAEVDRDLSIWVVGLLVIISKVNIARLIVTLNFLQIVMFLIAQFVGATVTLLVIDNFIPGSQPT